MSKFSVNTRTQFTAPIRTRAETPDTVTHEGAPAHTRDAKSDLFLLAVTNMVGEDTFYESSTDRDRRFRQLVRTVTADDPEWVARFIPWLRKEAFMRSAPIVALAEYVKAGGPNGRPLIAETLSRPDEPAELLGYWLSTYGRSLPAAIKRGIADAAVNLYTERNALRYDRQGHDVRMADVIELTHPKPKADWQSDLFRWLLDRRHNNDDTIPETLELVAERKRLDLIEPDKRRGMLGDVPIVSWEWLSGWLPDGMDAEAWEAAIPHMGYMALLRNLRNFDQVGISNESAKHVADKLADPEQVAKSRQFPFRFWTAYREVGNVRWSAPLEQAAQFATSNVPEFDGGTLVLADTSGSMQHPLSRRSSVMRSEIGGVFAGAINNADLVSFASTATQLPFAPGDSLVTIAKRLHAHIGRDGHGTDVNQGLRFYDPSRHKRIVIFTDEQFRYAAQLPEGLTIYSFNLAGYAPAGVPAGKDGVFSLGGFSDAAFRMIPLLEAGQSTDWPF